MKKKILMGMVKSAIAMAMSFMILPSSTILCDTVVYGEEITSVGDAQALESEESSQEEGSSEESSQEEGSSEESSQEEGSSEESSQEEGSSEESSQEEGSSEESSQEEGSSEESSQEESSEKITTPSQEEIDALTQQIYDSILVAVNENGEEEYQLIVRTQTDENGDTKYTTMQNHLETQTAITNAIKEALENALAENGGSELIEQYVDAAKQEAVNINLAVWQANQAYQKAEEIYLEEVQAEADYLAALEELTETIQGGSENYPDITKFQQELMKKTQAVESAKKDLEEIKKQQKDADSYVQWAKQLLKASCGEITTRVYGQLDTEDNSEIGSGNGQGYDTTDDTVISRDKNEFTEVTSGPEGVVVPYEIYQSYVASMYDRKDEQGNLIPYLVHGLGVAVTGEGTENATMPEIYWAYDATTGKIDVTKCFLKTSESREYPEWMTTEGSTYFKGYTFKWEDDGYYHIDGYLCTVNHQEGENPDPGLEPDPDPNPEPEPEPNPNPEPEPEPNPNPEPQPEPNPNPNPEPVEIEDNPTPAANTPVPKLVEIPSEPTPLADTPVPELVELPSEPTPLTDIPEEDVPLDSGVPMTGDYANVATPIGGLGFLIVMVGMVYNLTKKRKNS